MNEEAIWSSGNGKATRYCRINPDIIASFTSLPLKDVLDVVSYYPLYGTRGGRKNETLWMSFVKEPELKKEHEQMRLDI